MLNYIDCQLNETLFTKYTNEKCCESWISKKVFSFMKSHGMRLFAPTYGETPDAYYQPFLKTCIATKHQYCDFGQSSKDLKNLANALLVASILLNRKPERLDIWESFTDAERIKSISKKIIHVVSVRLPVLFNHTFSMNIYIYIKFTYLQLSLGSSKAVLISKWNPTFLYSLKSIICWESKWEMVKTFVNNQFPNKTNIQYYSMQPGFL